MPVLPRDHVDHRVHHPDGGDRSDPHPPWHAAQSRATCSESRLKFLSGTGIRRCRGTGGCKRLLADRRDTVTSWAVHRCHPERSARRARSRRTSDPGAGTDISARNRGPSTASVLRTDFAQDDMFGGARLLPDGRAPQRQVHHPAFHHELHPPHRLDLLKRVAVERDQVGLVSRGDRSDHTAESQSIGVT